VNPGIDPASPASEANSRPDQIIKCLQHIGNSAENIELLKRKTTVWIIGDVSMTHDEWKDAFIAIGFPTKDIIPLNIL
jgi:hypothetical protein